MISRVFGIDGLAVILRSRLWLVVVGLAVGALSAAASSASTGAVPSQPLTGRVPGTPPAQTLPGAVSVAGYRYRIVIEPELQAGGAGWSSFITYSLHGRIRFGGGGGAAYPTAAWPFLGFTFSYSGAPRLKGDVVDYVLTGPSVAAVRFGRRTVSTFTSPDLPVGDRAAVFFLSASSPPVSPYVNGLRPPGRSIRLVALDSQGRPIPLRSVPFPFIPSRFWQAPSAVTPNNHQPPYHGPTHPLHGACELAEHGLPGLTPEFGHVVGRLTPVQRNALAQAQGEVFLPCVDTEYYLHGWPLEVSVLVDALEPSHTLGAIPGAVPLVGHPGTVNLPAGQFPGSLTATQVGDAWLVVEGGANLAQRLRVLSALQIRKLDLGS